MLKTKSVWTALDRSDGLRVLATRFRGRGMPASRYDVWMPSLGPSERTLRAVQKGAISWKEFSKQYREELFLDGPIDKRSRTIKNHGQKFTLRLLKRLAQIENVTLLCHCAEDEQHCHRHLLRALIAGNRVSASRMSDPASCELCKPEAVIAENALAYARHDNNALSRGHVLVVPKRHVANFFDMNPEEQAAVLALLNQAERLIRKEHSPDGYNIGVNVGKAGGQARMHVHLHLIPRYAGDVPDPRGGIRCVLPGKSNR